MWHRDSDRFRLFTRRALMLGAGKGVLLTGLAARMYYLQVLESDRYQTLADENRISHRLLPPPRGLVTDRFGAPLAVNRQNYHIMIVREQTPDVRRTLEILDQIIELGPDTIERVERDAARRRSFVPVTVRDNLTWDEVARVGVNAPDLPGLIIDAGRSRDYPEGPHLAHTLGYVAAVSEKELTGDPLLELPGFTIGKNGIEKVYDLALRGTAGTSQVEVNALGRVIRELEREEGDSGNTVVMTLDLELQRYTNQRLSDQESAAAVVMDIHNGEVLALSSHPTYDPNAFTNGISHKLWNSLVNNPYAPLSNKAVNGTYAPGSTFKMCVALAGLEAGIISPNQKFFCNGHLDLGNARFHCWKRGGHGWMNMHDSIKHSCDVYYYEISQKIGIDRIAAMANKLGLGEDTGIDLPNERSGLIPTKDWKEIQLGKRWQGGETLIASIGQGYVLATPLQLCTMTARLASGKAVRPHLTRDNVTPEGVTSRQAEEFPELQVSRANLARIRDAMNGVTNELRGTGHGARIAIKGMEMAGKSGTSQVRRITMRERQTTGVLDNNDLPWKYRDHALFVAFAPVDNPRYACSVVVEHGGGGSSVAGPIVRDLLLKAQELQSARQGISAADQPNSANLRHNPAHSDQDEG
ncbi:MAG: penicillin-binding protein 2 [Thalassospira sp.]|uniref:penicillin-binding protein 2 n=1 Tax=Thalassospira sp. TaxID=1912094 RepID=UPI001B049F35|nr:penicillin-binding protein 2 [Thalassospira sp.]MBO6580233.1 penicillin-binding protein 2 [Thalassospira sp.]MBO6819970.1 penicillin-binding protein 2 [Thalassospira sp.]MBO6890025.1 penicillin-binding protein 2 [Thalassospira sp.]